MTSHLDQFISDNRIRMVAMTRKERDRANFLARVQAEQAARDAARPRRKARKAREQYASREEQRARYLDAGPLAWDDR